MIRERRPPSGRLIVVALLAVLSTIGVRSDPTPVLTVGQLTQLALSAGFDVRAAEIAGPIAVRSRFPFRTLDYADHQLERLRVDYRLTDLVRSAADEWTAQQQLKQWVHEAIPDGAPDAGIGGRSAADILRRAAAGEQFFCTHFAITYVEAALALGWQARRLAVDRRQTPDDPTSTNHGVAEVWSNQFAKWIAIDAQSNLHYEKDGVPLSAWEIREEFLRDRGVALDRIVGVPRQKAARGIKWWNRPAEPGIATYFWIGIYDDAVYRGDYDLARIILPQNTSNRGLVWYQNTVDGPGRRLHSGYRNARFLPTYSLDDAYWTVGVVETRVRRVDRERLLLTFDVGEPRRVTYRVSTDDGPWTSLSHSGVDWLLHQGENTLRVRSVAPGGVVGPETMLRLALGAGVSPD
jgi:hypothetical protein